MAVPLLLGCYRWCHIPVQCPPGGAKACKEYHNFKNFYSIVMMAIVDTQDRFIWASVGFPGNSHDSVIFQSTELWDDITENNWFFKCFHILSLTVKACQISLDYWLLA